MQRLANALKVMGNKHMDFFFLREKDENIFTAKVKE